MTSALLRHETPEEREYVRYLGEIEVRKQLVANASAELETLKSDLGRFEAEYHATVGVLFVELDRVKLAIEEYERRIWWLQLHPEKPLDEIERDVETSFETRRQEIEDEDETVHQYEQQYQHERRRPQLEPEENEELKRRYRELAKRFHPDLARTNEERIRRAAVMQQVNAAFQERDLSALTHLEHASQFDDPAFEARSIGEKLVWAIRELSRLDDLLMTLRHERDEVVESPTYSLCRRLQTEPDLIDRLVQGIEADLELARTRLATLVGTHRELLKERVLD